MKDVVEESFRIVLDPITYINNGETVELEESFSLLSKFDCVYDDREAHTFFKTKGTPILKEEADEEIMKAQN